MLEEVERRRGSVLARLRVRVPVGVMPSSGEGTRRPPVGGTQLFDKLEELPALLRESTEEDPKMPFPTLSPRFLALEGDPPKRAPNSLGSGVAAAELFEELLDILDDTPPLPLKKPEKAPKTPRPSFTLSVTLPEVVGRLPKPPLLLPGI